MKKGNGKAGAPRTSKGKGGKGKASFSRKWSRRIASVCAMLVIVLSLVGNWYVHHPRTWLQEAHETYPATILNILEYFGYRAGNFTDALGWTGHDAVYDSDDAAPQGETFFAGIPKRVSNPAPTDIVPIGRGSFVVGWSPTLRHPVYVAYHVPAAAKYAIDTRPTFKKDTGAKNCPAANAYERTGYDRGHMAPNHAIASRFGLDEQAKTFLMSNIAPQRPNLNRGPWRELEHRIADLWTAAYGEIWVIVGSVPAENGTPETISGTNIDVPPAFFMLITAQDENGVRVLSAILPQTVTQDDFPVKYLVTVDEIEKRTGLDFLSSLPDFLEEPLEADLPTRLWPIHLSDIFKIISVRL